MKKLLLTSLFLLPLLSGCAGQDPLTIKNLEAARQAWEEDRRPDLPNAKVDARNFFFDQALKYEQSKGR
jgi:hypothetical protein